MKSFKQLREECGCDKKERKGKKKGTVEVMPTVNDGQKGMVTKPTNETFAGNYQGPLYAPHPDLINEKAVSKKQQKFMGMVRAAQKGEKASSPEVAKVASSMKKKDVKDFASTKHKGLPEKKKMKENYDKGEYDYEGDMAKTQLKGVIRNAQELHDLLQPADNLPEWVQSKITLAADYIQTSADYMKSK